MWPFRRCVDCNHLCTGKCEVCGKPLCFECAGGIFQLHGYSPGFGKCNACEDEMDRQVKSAFPLLGYKSVLNIPSGAQIIPYNPVRLDHNKSYASADGRMTAQEFSKAILLLAHSGGVSMKEIPYLKPAQRPAWNTMLFADPEHVNGD